MVPNKHIAGEIQRNSRANRVVEGRIGTYYGANVERAVELVRAAVTDHEGVSIDPKVQAGVEMFGVF